MGLKELKFLYFLRFPQFCSNFLTIVRCRNSATGGLTNGSSEILKAPSTRRVEDHLSITTFNPSPLSILTQEFSYFIT
ncbi:hypothetical protein L1987_39220 [Smallanthus sonchifolius]|uniref:Uncharacterized protein n=1 Tax=Smallanthus sonchifolius TaxID=185202 RepID=A0ACB9HLE9_9ASTR|nr:hypothetical protein L1987_39220 [Smallanthus sonchifolius]